MQMRLALEIKRTLVAMVGVICAVAVARPASADDLLTIRFDLHGEEPPAQLCILADFAPGKLAKTLTEIRRELPVEPVAASPKHACRATSGLDAVPDAGLRYWCLENPAGKGEGVAYLRVDGAIVISSELSRNVARFGLRPRPKDEQSPARIELLGGDYYDQSPVAFRLSDGTQLTEISLIPRCAKRRITVPEYECAEGEAKGRARTIDGAVLSGSAGNSLDVIVYNGKGTGGKITLNDCGHTFAASFTGPAPPKQIELEAKGFWFQWTRNCLARRTCPRRPVLIGQSASCELLEEGRPVGEGERPKLKGTMRDQQTCDYSCTGDTRFPATVQMSFSQASVTRSWTENLGVPGQKLSGYIPEEQRRIALAWRWSESRSKRVDRTADEIRYVELRTPEGRLHRIHHDTAQVRIPELDCGDYVSYRYVGTRAFDEELVPVGEGGAVLLKDPKESRIDNFRLGAVLGGGVRHTTGTTDVNWGPQGDVEVVAVIRHLRDLFEWSSVALDFEVRVGAVLSDHPYCSRFTGDAKGKACQRSDWERMPYWRFPMTGGLNLHLPARFTVGWGLGAAPTTYHFAKDATKVSRPILGVMRTHLGYKLGAAVAFELYWHHYWGEEVWETVFDHAGVRSVGHPNGASTAQTIGIALRLDDLL